MMKGLLIHRFVQRLQENKDDSLKLVLSRTLYLAGYYSLDKYFVFFFQGGLFANENAVEHIRELILDLCKFRFVQFEKKNLQKFYNNN